MLFQIVMLLIQTLQLYQWILIIRILLTWLPSINWYNQPFRFLAAMTDPLLEPFRRIIPPIGMLDLSAMVLLFAISVLQHLLQMLAQSLSVELL
jgi:YggT family protein